MVANNSAGSDAKAHEQTYEGFTRLMKSGSIAVFIVAAIIILLISR